MNNDMMSQWYKRTFGCLVALEKIEILIEEVMAEYEAMSYEEEELLSPGVRAARDAVYDLCEDIMYLIRPDEGEEG